MTTPLAPSQATITLQSGRPCTQALRQPQMLCRSCCFHLEVNQTQSSRESKMKSIQAVSSLFILQFHKKILIFQSPIPTSTPALYREIETIKHTIECRFMTISSVRFSRLVVSDSMHHPWTSPLWILHSSTPFTPDRQDGMKDSIFFQMGQLRLRDYTSPTRFRVLIWVGKNLQSISKVSWLISLGFSEGNLVSSEQMWKGENHYLKLDFLSHGS